MVGGRAEGNGGILATSCGMLSVPCETGHGEQCEHKQRLILRLQSHRAPCLREELETVNSQKALEFSN